MANIIERIRGAARGFVAPNPALSPVLLPSVGEEKEYPLPLIWNLITPGRYNWSMIDYEAYAREGFSQNEVIYASLKYKFDSIAQTPLRAYKGKRNQPELSEAENSPLYQLAERPNEFMGMTQFLQLCVVYLNLHGNCFIYFQKKKQPYGLYPLRPDRVQIVPDENKRVIGYLYFPDGTSVEKSIPIRIDEMLHVKLPNPYDPLEGLGYGLSPLSAAARSGDVDNRMTQFLAEFFARNGIQPGGVIELPYESDIEDTAKLREQWLESYGGSAKWGKPMVIDSGGKYTPLSMTFTDMALDNIDLRNIRRITAVFGVDGKLIGLDNSSSTYNNVSEAENAFWTRVMITELKLFEEELYYKVKLGNEFLKFDISAIPAFAEDVTSKIDNYNKLVNAFVPPNIASERVGLNLPKLEGGDVGYAPSSLIPIEQVLNPPEPQAPAQLPEGALDGEIVEDEEEAPTPDAEDEAKKAVRKGIRTLKLRFDYDTKDKMAESQDRIAREYEPKLAKTALEQFRKDRNEVMRLFNKAQKSNRKAHKSFDWNDFENSIRFYLFVKGQGEWSYEFAVWFVELAWDARDDWIDRMKLREAFPTIDFDAIFLSRASIEGEAWFANYTLQFARAINKTTYEGIHAVVRDGLENGFGTDKIGKKLQLLFDQYMEGGTSPEDWDFMAERMPAYRVEMIARTETHGAMSAANHSFFKRTGATHKSWWATNDDRTRETHLVAWNRYSEGGTPGIIPIDEDFIVGGATMKYPGDKSAPIGEWIQCRCVEMPEYPEED